MGVLSILGAHNLHEEMEPGLRAMIGNRQHIQLRPIYQLTAAVGIDQHQSIFRYLVDPLQHFRRFSQIAELFLQRLRHVLGHCGTLCGVRSGSELVMVQKTRSLQVESSTSVVRTIIPDAFVASLPEVRRRGELRRRGDKVEVVFPRHVTSQGVHLRDSDSESLPTTADDGRVFDQDGDGNPGLTVRIEGVVSGNLYVIRRGWDEWHGIIDDSGEVQGSIRWDMDQVILGATSRFLRSQPQTSPDNEKSYFRMRP